MSLALGVSCREGAVIATDSMALMGNPATEWRLVSKFSELRRWQAVWANYGAQAEGPTTLDLTLSSSVASVHLRALELAELIDHDPSDQAGTLAAGTEAGTVQLIKWSGTECQVAPSTGAVFFLGWAAHCLEPEDPPPTLDGCRELALKLARKAIDRCYAISGKASLEEFLAERWLPKVAYPIQLATLRPNHMEIETCLQ